MSPLSVAIQVASTEGNLPEHVDIEAWAQTALTPSQTITSELSIRIVDQAESATLNQQYRQKTGPTNVLSFPYEGPTQSDYLFYGDLVLCAPIIRQEATAQNKSLSSHWAHLIIHGCLHLIGYDHVEPTDAERMENKEIILLKKFKINNPYDTME